MLGFELFQGEPEIALITDAVSLICGDTSIVDILAFCQWRGYDKDLTEEIIAAVRTKERVFARAHRERLEARRK